MTAAPGGWMKVHTTPGASREVAWRKLCAKIPEEYRFCVRLVKGKLVTL